MTVTELLAAIRAPYISLLSEASKDEQVIIEPAYRLADGSLAMDGTPPLPCRADLISTKGESAGASSTVDSSSQLQFEPISFALAATRTTISPFTWDWVPLQIRGLASDAVTSVLVTWFMEWFDPNDKKLSTDQGLYGVVHFMSSPEENEGGVHVDIDLGSASEEALEELLFRLSDEGALEVHVGSQETPPK